MRSSILFATIVAVFCFQSGSAFIYKLTRPDNDSVCLYVETTSELQIYYNNIFGKTVSAIWTLGEADEIRGQCESGAGSPATLNLNFTRYQLQMTFGSVNGSAFLNRVDLTVNVRNDSFFVNPSSTGEIKLSGSPGLRLSPDDEYFACASVLSLPFTVAQVNGSVLIMINTKIQAFGVSNDSLSSRFATCAQDSTSPAPTESTTAPVVTTTSPAVPTTASPEPPLLNLVVQDPVTKVPCLRLKLRASLAILYDLKSGGNATVSVPLPADTKASGDCGNSSQIIWLTFLKDWRASMTFSKMPGGGYGLQLITADYRLSPDLFPNAAQPNANRSAVGNQTYFSVASGSGYYTCASAETLRLDSSVAMDVKNLRAQAFRTYNGTDEFFGTAEQCLADTPIDNVVPIVVGAALAGLVIIVLIAYLIGRRRHSAGGGYQSV